MQNRNDASRVIRAPRGKTISCKNWQAEAALRMLMNNLDAEVAERPAELVVYGGIGRAARNWECFDKIVEVLKRLEAAGLVQLREPPPLDLTLLQGLHAEDYLDAFERGTEPLASSQGIAWSAAVPSCGPVFGVRSSASNPSGTDDSASAAFAASRS